MIAVEEGREAILPAPVGLGWDVGHRPLALDLVADRVAVIALVSDQTPGFVPRPALCFPGNIDIFQCLFEQRRFVRAHKYLSYEMAFRKFAARIKQSDFFSAYKIFSDHV